jgi:chemotaxis protein histidine kinase CheA
VVRDGDDVMSDLFAERMAAVRQRFFASLDARIDGIETAMPRPGEVGLDALAQAHRDAHHLCGVGATLGFVGTGKVARSIEQLLLAAVKARRALTDDEIPRLRERIALLRSTASAEMGAVQ